MEPGIRTSRGEDDTATKTKQDCLTYLDMPYYRCVLTWTPNGSVRGLRTRERLVRRLMQSTQIGTRHETGIQQRINIAGKRDLFALTGKIQIFYMEITYSSWRRNIITRTLWTIFSPRRR